jgi:hypothetical protein
LVKNDLKIRSEQRGWHAHLQEGLLMRGKSEGAHRDTNSFWRDGKDYRLAFGNWNREFFS